ncbi:MAG: DUF5615 family PIN-like protein [Tepidisphaeraceae bacterium]
MKLLLDNGLPRSAAAILLTGGFDAVHAGQIGLSDAADKVILDRAATDRCVIVTLDADFHTYLALSGASGPSVIRIRIEGLKGPQLAALIGRIIRRFSRELETGAAISVGPRTARCHVLPLK